MLGVCDRITDDLEREISTSPNMESQDGTNVFQEAFENTTGLLVDQTRDTLDTASTSETTDGGLGDALDVVAQDLAVTLCATLSETLRNKSTPAEIEQGMIRNGPFHLCHGQTLLCEEVVGG